MEARTWGETCRQLGELRRFSVGAISERGRGSAPGILVGDEVVGPLEMRRGCTLKHSHQQAVAQTHTAGQTYRLRCHLRQ